jgi:hypothetical protein
MPRKDALRGPKGEDIPWKLVLFMIAIMLTVGVGTALVSTHEHIQGRVVEVGTDAVIDWDYLVIEVDTSEYLVYNIFPNSPRYEHDEGDWFDEWVPDGLWVEY